MMISAAQPSEGGAAKGITHQLAEMIAALELPPGAVVSESYLTRLLKCGRTPLREALKILEHEELLAIIPKAGICIAGISITDYPEVSSFGMLLYSKAAAWAATRATEEQLVALNTIVAEGQRAVQERAPVAKLLELDREFHGLINEAARNRWLAKTFHWHNLRLGRFTRVAYDNAYDSAVLSWSEHAKMLSALRRRDPEEAERCAAEHVANVSERVKATL